MIIFMNSGTNKQAIVMRENWERGVFFPNETASITGQVYVPGSLKQYAEDFDLFLVRLGFSGLTITSLLREFDPNRLSYHAILQAFDGRRWGIEKKHVVAINHWIRAHRIIYPMIQFVWEKDHFHVEFDNNHPLIKGDMSYGQSNVEHSGNTI